MRPWHSLFIIALTMTGCTHIQLRNSTLSQVATISDLRYQQVMDNLARAVANPSFLPYFAVIEQGTTQIQDLVANPSGSLTWNQYSITQEVLGLNASRTVADQWSQDPIKDPDRLKAMQCAYLYLLGGPEAVCGECAEILKHFQVDEELARIPAGWFRVGKKKDVPRRACYVGHHCGTYVWVPPDGIDGLTRFTYVIMDIATVDTQSLAPPTQQVVEKIYAGSKLVKTITYQEERKEAKGGAAGTAAYRPKLRTERLLISPGNLMFTPGSPGRGR
jgi:hypothetical protein